MAAAAGGGGGEQKMQQPEKKAVSSSRLFERRHGELVMEAEELAASCGADVTVLAFSPRSGEPCVSHFGGGGGGGGAVPRPEEVASMGLDEVVALEERLRLLRQLVLRRINDDQEKVAAAADGPPAVKP